MGYKDRVYPSERLMRQEKCRPMDPSFKRTGNFLINIRGTNGSGKTYTVRQILSGFKLVREFQQGGIHVSDYGCFYLLGSYESACGGLDTVGDFYTIAPTVKSLIQEKSILMEGLLWSSVFSAMHHLEHDLRAMGHESIWLGFNYTVETMINRVMSRRLEAKNFKPLKVQNLVSKVSPVTHGLNNSIAFGSKVFVGCSEDISLLAATVLRSNDDSEFTDWYLKESQWIPDFEYWNDIVTKDPEHMVHQRQCDIDAHRTTISLF